jgi:uncharacterized protein
MAIRKLAIVGASARAAAFSAMRAGYEVVAADLFADADLERVAPATRIENYPDGLADWLAKVDCDAWMYTGALENYPDLVDRMASIAPLAGNGGAALRDVRDPFALQSAVRQAGLCFPETVAYADGLPLDGSWLCKTYRGASGSGVWALDGEAALARAQRERAVFQLRLDPYKQRGTPAVILAIGSERSDVLGYTEQWTGKSLMGVDAPWTYAASHSPFMTNALVVEQFIRLRGMLEKTFGLRGVAGVDAFLDEEYRLWVLEVNPRYTASAELVERITSRFAIAAHLAACGFADWEAYGAPVQLERNSAPTRSFAKAILFSKRDVTITESFHRWALEKPKIDLAQPKLADIPHPGETIARGRPVLTVFVDGPNFVMWEYLKARVAEVEKHLYDDE